MTKIMTITKANGVSRVLCVVSNELNTMHSESYDRRISEQRAIRDQQGTERNRFTWIVGYH